MDDMNGFERQVVDQIHRFAGPPRPVDDAAIFAALTVARSPAPNTRSLLGALKFAVAVFVLALTGGGVLLIGAQPSVPPKDAVVPATGSPVLTTPSPSATPALSPEAIVEEQVPGTTFSGSFSMIGEDRVAPAGEDNRQKFSTFDVTDPRFAGDGELTWTTGDLMAHTWRIENAQGSWLSRPLETPVTGPPAAGDVDHVIFDGAGAYRGLVAIVTMRHSGYGTQALEGSIAPASRVPQTRQGILPGVDLHVEEARPGVFLVVGDGVHDLSSHISDLGPTDVATGHDGSVWLRGWQGAIRLGRAGTLTSPMSRSFQVGPDGTVWTIGPELDSADGDAMNGRVSPPVLRSYDGEGWTAYPAPTVQGAELSDISGFDVTTDGTVWGRWMRKGGRSLVARLGPDGWHVLKGKAPEVDIVVTDDGMLWAQDDAAFYEDGRWKRDPTNEMALVGRNGTVWIVSTQPLKLQRDLGNGLKKCDRRGVSNLFQPLYPVAVTPDGSLWGMDGYTADARLIRFDCTGFTYPLGDAQIVSAGIADDGKVWVLATLDQDSVESDAPLSQLYVITPAAFVGGGAGPAPPPSSDTDVPMPTANP